MTDERDEFARQLRGATPFGRHKLSYALGVGGAALGFALLFLRWAPAGLSLGAPGLFLAAWHARQGNRAMNVAEDRSGFPDLNTRQYEDLSPEGHARNASRVAVQLTLGGLFLIVADIVLLVNR